MITDAFSKYSRAIPIPNKEAKTVAESIFKHYICIFSVPRILVSDRGLEYTNKVLRELELLLQIDHHLTAAFHPASNSPAESYNRQIIKFLTQALHASPGEQWDELLPSLELSYNTHTHQSTLTSPFMLTFKNSPRLPYFDLDLPSQDTRSWQVQTFENMKKAFDLARSTIDKAAEADKKRFDVNTKERQLQVDDQVIVFYPKGLVAPGRDKNIPKKFQTEGVSGFKIVKQVAPYTYKVQKGKGRESTVNLERLVLDPSLPKEAPLPKPAPPQPPAPSKQPLQIRPAFQPPPKPKEDDLVIVINGKRRRRPPASPGSTGSGVLSLPSPPSSPPGPPDDDPEDRDYTNFFGNLAYDSPESDVDQQSTSQSAAEPLDTQPPQTSGASALLLSPPREPIQLIPPPPSNPGRRERTARRRRSSAPTAEELERKKREEDEKFQRELGQAMNMIVVDPTLPSTSAYQRNLQTVAEMQRLTASMGGLQVQPPSAHNVPQTAKRKDPIPQGRLARFGARIKEAADQVLAEVLPAAPLPPPPDTSQAPRTTRSGRVVKAPPHLQDFL
mgnify:CR=1 FL=1